MKFEPVARRWRPTLLRHPSAVLLAVQLIGVLLYPFMADE